MKFVTLTDDQAKSKFEEFYEGSMLTFAGMVPEEAQLYVDYFKDFTTVDESVDGYIYTGKAMNTYYHLRGKKRYPEDLHFLTIPLKAFKECGKIAIPRFQIGGRWFDDIVDNNRR